MSHHRPMETSSPSLPHEQADAVARRTPQGSLFGEWLVLREAEPRSGEPLRLPMTCAEEVTRALRGTFLSHADDPPPAALSGHMPGGRPLEQAHAAFLALPDLGSNRMSSSSPGNTLLGAAVLLPRDIDPGDRMAIIGAAARWERAGLRLRLGRLGVMELTGVAGEAVRGEFGPDVWRAPSRRWASVTPVALDHNPGNLFAHDPGVAARAEEHACKTVAGACRRVGLPSPQRVRVARHSLHEGVPDAAGFMPYPRRGHGFTRVCVHVELVFDEPVAGPVLIGAGRYFGIGLCAPAGGQGE